MKLARPKSAKKEASRNFRGKISIQVKTSICEYIQREREEKEGCTSIQAYSKGIKSEILSHAVKQTAHFCITMMGTPMSGHRRSSDGSLGEFHTTTTLFR